MRFGSQLNSLGHLGLVLALIMASNLGNQAASANLLIPNPGPATSRGVEWDGGFTYSNSSATLLKAEIRALVEDLKSEAAETLFKQLVRSIEPLTLRALAISVDFAFDKSVGNTWFRVTLRPGIDPKTSLPPEGRRVQALGGYFDHFAIRAIGATAEDRMDIRIQLLSSLLAASGLPHSTTQALATQLARHVIPFHGTPAKLGRCSDAEECAAVNGIAAYRRIRPSPLSPFTLWRLTSSNEFVSSWSVIGGKYEWVVSREPHAIYNDASMFCQANRADLPMSPGSDVSELNMISQIQEIRQALTSTKDLIWVHGGGKHSFIQGTLEVSSKSGFSICVRQTVSRY